MKDLVLFEFKKFFSKKKNIIAIAIFLIFIISFIFINDGLNSQKGSHVADSYSGELSSTKNALIQMKNDKNPSQSELNAIDDCKHMNDLMEARLQAKLNNDWKGELKSQIEIDKTTLANIKSGKTVSGQKPEDIQDEISINEILYKNNIKPIITENSMTAYNFLKLSEEQILPIFSVILVLLLSADVVASESDEGTFKFLLVQPISRTKVILSKIISSSIICLLIEILIMLIFFLSLGIIKGFGSPLYPVKYFTGSFSFFNTGAASHVKFIGIRKMIFLSIPLNILFIMFTVSLGILISTIFQNGLAAISTAVILATGINIFNSNLKLFKKVSHLIPFSYGSSIDVLSGDLMTAFGNKYLTCLTGMIILVLFSIVFYFITCKTFSKKDII